MVSSDPASMYLQESEGGGGGCRPRGLHHLRWFQPFSKGVDDLEPYKKEYEDIIKDEYEYIMKCLDVAIAKNNADSDKPKLKFASLKKTNGSGCAGVVYYITFVAKHVDSGKNFTFQAKVLGRRANGKIHVLTFRPLYKSPDGLVACKKGEFEDIGCEMDPKGSASGVLSRNAGLATSSGWRTTLDLEVDMGNDF
ncbi:hypothetical protein Tsubulata_024330 [Turnera subulata]|uniref:Cystatin domain-containing protein n=1 Tax=Turnera subulata TaxID=218843 RepID=A0A9Q0F6J3_9ROSI|nr:hypothetical protein Tsubulata_024330 [Turnera subulata]